ncbi:MAG: hypothetical protein HZB65_03275 [Candidatus Aenigmarchaeota archaeon]|nr:hypothetical protein [Candidatus Aenigmarchaeota archaeon]
MAKKNWHRNSSQAGCGNNFAALSHNTNSYFFSRNSHNKKSLGSSCSFGRFGKNRYNITNKSGNKKHLTTIVIAISLIGIVSVSGCVGAEFFDGIFGKVADFFGMDVIKPSRDVSTVGVVNPLVIDRVWTMPENRVIPDMPLSVFMEISNVDNDPMKNPNVAVDIFDAGVFRNSEGTEYCNKYEQNEKTPKNCGPSQCGLAVAVAAGGPGQCEMKIGSTKQALFELKAPDENAIAGVITKQKLNYKVLYNYEGATNFEVLVVDYQEIIKRQKEGRTLSTNLIDTKGSGPIKIDAELATPYIISKQLGDDKTPDSAKSSAYITFKLRNAGAGALKDSTIETNMFNVFFPKALIKGSIIANIEVPKYYDATAGTMENAFSCGNSKEKPEDIIICTNVKNIEFFKKESEPLQFIIKDVSELTAGTPHKTYLISADVAYDYELRGAAEVTVNPILKR